MKVLVTLTRETCDLCSNPQSGKACEYKGRPDAGKSMRWIWTFALILFLSLPFMGLYQTAQAIPNGGYAHPQVLIQPEELRTLIQKRDPQIRIIDMRKEGMYLAGHVPGSVQVWRPDVEDKNRPVPGMMARQEQVEELMGRLGIRNNNLLVIYSDRYDHARLWWILTYYGFPLSQMRLLDGGIEGWEAEGYPVEMTPSKTEKTRFTLQERPKKIEPLLCTLPEVRSALSKPDSVVLDVRSKEEFLGETKKKGASKGGHIPGVTRVEWKEAVVEDGPYRGYWKSAREIMKVFSAKGVTPEKEIYIY